MFSERHNYMINLKTQFMPWIKFAVLEIGLCIQGCCMIPPSIILASQLLIPAVEEVVRNDFVIFWILVHHKLLLFCGGWQRELDVCLVSPPVISKGSNQNCWYQDKPSFIFAVISFSLQRDQNYASAILERNNTHIKICYKSLAHCVDLYHLN